MQDSYTIKQAMSFGEFLSVTLYYYSGSRWIKRFIIFYTIGILLMHILDWQSGHRPNLTDILTYLLPIFILIIVIFLFVLVTTFSIYKTKPFLFQDITYDFTHWGIVRNGEQTDFSKPWREISQLKETRAFFIFYVGQSDFHFIQKKMFANEKELDAFRGFVQTKMASSSNA